MHSPPPSDPGRLAAGTSRRRAPAHAAGMRIPQLSALILLAAFSVVTPTGAATDDADQQFLARQRVLSDAMVLTPIPEQVPGQPGFPFVDRLASHANWRTPAEDTLAPSPNQEPSPSDAEPVPAVVGSAEDALSSLSAAISPSPGRLPDDVAAGLFAREGVVYHAPGVTRAWPVGTYQWEASSLFHQPLYFEEANLERNGFHAPVVQPLLSAASFYARVPALPYLMALDPPCEHMYVLGQRRPGTCVARPLCFVPIRIGPGAVQAAVIAGLILAIP